eukprot:6180029-Pleurochrysis_carterae.AAC.1
MLQAYGAAHDLAPNIDKLAQDGLVFVTAYTPAPLCTPARYSLLTGRFASNASSIVAHRPWSLVGFNTFLTGKEPTMANFLRKQGYLTALVGKYHLGFPMKVKGERRAHFSGTGRGYLYEELRDVVQTYSGFDDVRSLAALHNASAYHDCDVSAIKSVLSQYMLTSTSLINHRKQINLEPTSRTSKLRRIGTCSELYGRLPFLALKYASLRLSFKQVDALWGGNKQTAQNPHHPEWMAVRMPRCTSKRALRLACWG